MTKNIRVFDETRNCEIRYRDALRLIRKCIYGWVVEGVSVRRLSLQEQMGAAAKQEKLKQPLAYAEIFGLRYRPTEANERQHYQGMGMVGEAIEFARSAVA